MIVNINSNLSFYATVNYVLGKPGAALIGGNMAGTTLTQLVNEFALSEQLNDTVRRPVFHASLSIPHTDRLDDQQFKAIARSYFERMGYSPMQHQFVAVRHTDANCEHIHIVGSRINLQTGRVANNSFERYRSQEVVRSIEQQYGLSPVLSSWEIGQRALDRGQLESDVNQWVMNRLQQHIDDAFALTDPPKSLAELSEYLLSNRVTLAIARDDDKGVRGVSYCLDEVAIAGYRLGNRYSLPGLEQRGISFDERAIAAAEQLPQQAAYFKQIQSSVLSIWDTLNRLNTTLVNGKRYRLTIRASRAADGQLQTEFSIYRKGGDQQQLVLNIVNSEPKKPLNDLRSLSVKLSQMQLDPDICRTFELAQMRMRYHRRIVQRTGKRSKAIGTLAEL